MKMLTPEEREELLDSNGIDDREPEPAPAEQEAILERLLEDDRIVPILDERSMMYAPLRNVLGRQGPPRRRHHQGARMTGGSDTSYDVVRTRPGPNTGDVVYIVRRADGTETRIDDPFPGGRVRVVEGDIKFGPRKVELR